jgi:hypothetical protein
MIYKPHNKYNGNTLIFLILELYLENKYTIIELTTEVKAINAYTAAPPITYG